MNVKEIFCSIQGEGPDVGTPAIFVRFKGCHIKCWFCDDKTYEGGETATPSSILQVVDGFSESIPMVVLTGGEPILQPVLELRELILGLRERGKRVQIETSGVVWYSELTPLFVGDDCTVICSPKTERIHPDVEKIARAFKYIIDCEDLLDSKDGLPLYDVKKSGYLARPPKHIDRGRWVFVQPCDVSDVQRRQRNIELCIRLAKEHGYRISLQVHKILGLP